MVVFDPDLGVKLFQREKSGLCIKISILIYSKMVGVVNMYSMGHASTSIEELPRVSHLNIE